LLWNRLNFANTRLATVVRRLRARRGIIQQLWDVYTGELLWTHRQAHPPGAGYKMFPRFTPNGDRVGFYDGRSIVILDAQSRPPVQLEKIDIESQAPSDIGVVYSFTLGPGATRVALAGSNILNRPIRTTNHCGRSIDIIGSGSDERTLMYYTADGKALFCASHRMSISQLEIFRFDLDAHPRYESKLLENVAWVHLTNLVESCNEYTNDIETLFLIQLRYHTLDSAQLCLAVSAELREIKSHLLGKYEGMIVSQSEAVLVDYASGTVSNWQILSPLPERVATFDEDIRDDVDMPVAFNKGRLTFISNEGKFIFIDTVSESQ
jgi:hypothetical protein